MKKLTIIIEVLVDDNFNLNQEELLSNIVSEFSEDLLNNSEVPISDAWLEEILSEPYGPNEHK